MGEISFLYQIKSLPRAEQGFRYWYSDTTKYSFAYQRYVTLSDTSIINSPVAITKVAAGLSNLYGLFVTNREPMIPDSLDGFNVYKNPKDTVRHVYEQVRQEGHSMIEQLDAPDFVYHDIRENMSIFDTNSHLFREIIVNNNNKYTAMLSRQNFRESLNIWEQYFGNYDKFANWYQQTYATIDRNSFNILPMFNTASFDIHGNYMENIFGVRPDLILNKQDVEQGSTHEFTGQISDYVSGNRPDPIVNKLKLVFAKPNKPIMVNWLKNVFGKYSTVYHLHKFDAIFNSREKHSGNAYEITLGTPGIKHVRENPHILSGTAFGKQSNIFYNYTGQRQRHFGLTHKDISGRNFGKHADVNNQYYAKRFSTPAVYWDYTNCSTKEVKYGFYCNDALVDYAMKYLGYHDDVVFGIKDRIYGMLNYDNAFCIDGGKDVMTTIGVYITTNAKPSGILYNNTFFSRHGKSSSISGQGEHIIKWRKSLHDIIAGNTFVHKIYKEIGLFNTEKVFGTKTAHNMRIALEGLNLFKAPYDFTILKDNKTVAKDRLPLGPEWENLFIHKVPKDMEILIIPDSVYKVPYSMEISQDIVSALKTKYDLMIDMNDAFTFKVMYHAWADSLDSTGGQMMPRHTADFKVGLHALKTQFEANYLSSTDTALKDWLPLDLANTITKGYYGMIIPCSKVRHQGFVDDVTEMAIKNLGHVMLNKDCAATTIPKNVAIPDIDLFCDKDAHQVFIDNRNYWAIKSAIRAIIHKDEFAFKDTHKASYLTQIWASKDRHGIYMTPQYLVFKDRLKMSIMEQSHVFKDREGFVVHEDEFVNKDDKMCYYYYDVIAEKERIGMLLQQDTIATQERRSMNPLINITAFLDSSVLNLYEPMLFVPAIIDKLNLIQASEEIHREAYDVSEFANDYGNWVWVYEPPDPFDHLNQLYGIDELLLPENDTRYEDFENIIFDKETLMPRDPVKMIDNTTFIARFPIHHPIEEYADIGKIYDDSAKTWENYFGIETDVMHEIFLKYYQIWQARIFEFSTMTMQQATKRMLDLLYSWITLYYPIDKMDQALRVFRQIRWYSESAIIRNSQYIVSYEYDTLRSNLHKGSCDIPNDLDTNPTMYITQGVIRNNPDYIGQEASVTFTIETQKNTWFRFSLTNQLGTVKVYVNDVLVGMYPRSQIGITIELPYTTGTNCVKIVKEANHNIDSNFYIGNIEVPEASFKDLTIKFDPVLRAGNKPLNEVAKKLIAFANLHANRNEMYQVARRSNVGISETYKKMNEYWKNHHQNKSKGKRLTIKQV